MSVTIAESRRAQVRAIGSVADRADLWQATVREAGGSSVAHSPEWFTIIHDTYGHDPLYLTAEDEDGERGVLPAFVIRRPFFGTVVTSMPFLDTGGPCAQSERLTRMLVTSLVDEARRIKAQFVELRCTDRVDAGVPPMEHKVSMMLPLPSNPEALWRRFDSSVRNQIRKAERAGLSVEFGGAEKLASFYETFSIRMRDLGSPVHASGFLRAVVDGFGNRARIVLVRKGDATIGGLVGLAFKDTLVVPWASCLTEYLPLCPNMLLYWETLRMACRDGFGTFDFGRSSRGSGTYRFKRQWGAEERPLFWYTIPIGSQPNAAIADGRTGAFLATLWRRLPLPLTRGIGPSIRKYLTQ